MISPKEAIEHLRELVEIHQADDCDMSGYLMSVRVIEDILSAQKGSTQELVNKSRDDVLWSVYDHLSEKFDFNKDPVLEIVAYLVDSGIIKAALAQSGKVFACQHCENNAENAETPGNICAECAEEDQAARAQQAGSGETDFRAEIRTERDPSDECASFLTLVSEGKSSPYMYIPETLDQDVLDEVLRRLNTHPSASRPNLSTIAQKKLDQMGATVHGVLVKNEAGAWAAVSDSGRVMWLDGFEGQANSPATEGAE